VCKTDRDIHGSSRPGDDVRDHPGDSRGHSSDRRGLHALDAVRSSCHCGNGADLRRGGADAPPVRWPWYIDPVSDRRLRTSLPHRLRPVLAAHATTPDRSGCVIADACASRLLCQNRSARIPPRTRGIAHLLAMIGRDGRRTAECRDCRECGLRVVGASASKPSGELQRARIRNPHLRHKHACAAGASVHAVAAPVR
jgi:hypothetical protein